MANLKFQGKLLYESPETGMTVRRTPPSGESDITFEDIFEDTESGISFDDVFTDGETVAPLTPQGKYQHTQEAIDGDINFGATRLPITSKDSFIQQELARGVPEDEVMQQFEGPQQPFVDVPMVATGAFGATAWTTKSAVKGLISATSASLMEPIIGTAAEIIGENHPKLAIPFNILLGVLSGVTIERAIDMAILRAFKGKVAPKILDEAIPFLRGDFLRDIEALPPAKIPGRESVLGSSDDIQRILRKMREGIELSDAEHALMKGAQAGTPDAPAIQKALPQGHREASGDVEFKGEDVQRVIRKLKGGFELDVNDTAILQTIKRKVSDEATEAVNELAGKTDAGKAVKKGAVASAKIIGKEATPEQRIAVDRIKMALDKPGFLQTAEDRLLLQSLERTEAKLFDQFGRPLEDTVFHMGIPIHKIIPKKWKGRWQEFWAPFSTTPMTKALKFARSRGKGDLDTADRITAKITEKISMFPLEMRKDMFRALDGKIDMADLPKEAQRIARQIQQRTITVGKMLVKRGLISEKQFEKHKGKYVHYMYAKHILGDDKITGVRSTGKLDMDYTFARNPDMTEEQRMALGLIDDASVAVPVGMGKSLSDIAKFDYLAKIAKNPKWVWTPSMVRVGNKSVGIGKLAREVDAYRKVATAMPDNIEVQKTLQGLEDTLAKAMEKTKNVPEDFVQLPASKTYGELSGAFVRKSIADDLTPIVDHTSDAATVGRMLNVMSDVSAKSMAVFKASKVALNPPTMFRNMVSGVFQNNMRGRALAKIPGDYMKAAQSILKKDKFYIQARRNGLFRTNWAVTEIKEVLDTFTKIHNDGGNIASFFEGIKKMTKFYGKIDDFAKLAIYRQMREAGNSTADSVLEAQKWGMDYSLTSRSVKGLRKHIVPFLTYQYKIAPLIYESLTKRPWVIAKFAAAPAAMAFATQQVHNISDKDWTKLKKEMSFFIRKEGTHMIMPYKSPEGNWQWVNLEYYFPWGNFHQAYNDLKNHDWSELVKDTGALGNPLIDLAAAMKMGGGGDPPIDPFTKKPLYSDLDTPAQQYFKIAEFLYNKWAPSAITRYGASGYTMRVGEEDKYGKTVTPGQALGRWFGWNIKSATPKQIKLKKAGMIKDLERQYFKLAVDPTVDKETLNEKKRVLKEKIGQIKRLEVPR